MFQCEKWVEAISGNTGWFQDHIENISQHSVFKAIIPKKATVPKEKKCRSRGISEQKQATASAGHLVPRANLFGFLTRASCNSIEHMVKYGRRAWKLHCWGEGACKRSSMMFAGSASYRCDIELKSVETTIPARATRREYGNTCDPSIYFVLTLFLGSQPMIWAAGPFQRPINSATLPLHTIRSYAQSDAGRSALRGPRTASRHCYIKTGILTCPRECYKWHQQTLAP